MRMVDSDGVNVTFVEPGSPAHKAGIRTDDFLKAIDSKPVSSVEEAREAAVGRLPCPGGRRPRRGSGADAKTTVSIKVRVGIRLCGNSSVKRSLG